MTFVVTVRHHGTGEVRELTISGPELAQWSAKPATTIGLAWPMCGTEPLDVATGWGTKEATQWRITEQGRVALQLRPFRERRETQRVPRSPRAPNPKSAAARTLDLFDVKVG